ncbi:MAG: S8 family serine peptidase, partial [Bacteroidota bacterium]
GVAFNARIIPIRMAIVSPEGFFLNLTETMKATCFNEAVNRGADIISCSWGGGAASAQLNAAIQNAVSNGRNGRGGQGCIVLFSAGNNNASISSEASNQNVIAVGASSTCDTRKRSSNNPALVNPGVSPDPEGVSCDGEGWWGSNFGTGLDVLAPGVWITTTDNVGANGFVAGNFNDRFNGTSAACPNAAAVVALILSVNPNLTGVQARDILEQTCFKIPNGNFQANVAGQPNGTWSNQAGHGRLNAAAAVCRAFETSMSIIGPSLVCSGNNSFSVLNLPAGSNVAWTSNTAGLQLTSGQGTASAIFARQNNFNGQALITAANNSGCGSINLPPLSVWVGNPPADNSTLIWTGVRGTNPVTLNAGSINQYQCDFVPYADSYTWILPRGFVAVGSTTTPSRFISITTTNQIGTYNIFCRANNGACFSWTRSLTVNVVSSGGGGQQMRIAFPNPANNSISVKLKEEDNKEQTEVSLFNKNMERIYYIRTEEKDISISTTNILPGLYYLNIVIGKDITQQQIVISH